MSFQEVQEPRGFVASLKPPGERIFSSPQEEADTIKYGKRGPPRRFNSRASINTFLEIEDFINSNKDSKLKIITHVSNIIAEKILKFRSDTPVKFSRTRLHHLKEQAILSLIHI